MEPDYTISAKNKHDIVSVEYEIKLTSFYDYDDDFIRLINCIVKQSKNFDSILWEYANDIKKMSTKIKRKYEYRHISLYGAM